MKDKLSLNIITLTNGVAFDTDTTAVTLNHATAFAAELTFANLDRAITIVAAGGDDSITGGAGADNITGGAGADTIIGNAGNDVISGGAAADQITGSAGADTLTGGAGIDVFIYAGAAGAQSTLGAMDRIVDYRLATGDNAGALDTLTIGIDGAQVVGTVATVQDFSAQTSLGAALNAAANGNALDQGVVVFIFGGNTYTLVETVGAGTAYVGTDFLIEMVGTPFTTSTAITSTGFTFA